MRYIIAFLMVLGIMFSGSAMAQQKHQALLDLEDKGFTVDFLGQDFGMDGWLVQDRNGQVQYAYSNDEGALVLGMMFGPDAELHTAKQLQAYRGRVKEGSQAAMRFDDRRRASAAPRSEQMYADIEHTKWFSVGSAEAPYIYTFLSPTCSHCITFWNDRMKSLVDQGALQIRFVPFGVGRENRDAAAVLLSAKNAEELWRRYADGDEDALTKDGDIFEGIYQAVDFNADLFEKWDLPVSPFSVYRAPADGKIKVISGVPENTMMIMADFMR